MIASIALSISSPMPALLAWTASESQRAPSGTQKTPSPVYSSMSSRNCPNAIRRHLVGEELGADLVAALGEGVGDVLEEDQAEDEVLVLGGVHRAAELVGRVPQDRVQFGRGLRARQRRLVRSSCALALLVLSGQFVRDESQCSIDEAADGGVLELTERAEFPAGQVARLNGAAAWAHSADMPTFEVRMTPDLARQMRWAAGGRCAYPRMCRRSGLPSTPNRMSGLPCIRDTRVTVSAVLGQLAAGLTIPEFLANLPYLERADVLAALEFAAAAVQERELPLAQPA